MGSFTTESLGLRNHQRSTPGAMADVGWVVFLAPAEPAVGWMKQEMEAVTARSGGHRALAQMT